MAYVSTFDTKFGKVSIKADEEGILSVSGLYEPESDETFAENEWTKEAKRQLMEYFNGDRKDFDLPLKLSGTPFQNSVWNALRTIPYGTTVSYKDICKRIGNERACQAVGTAVGKNPFYIVIPCHRVISKDGTIGGYALGVEQKRKLLNFEGIQI